ncbi:MAG: BspA family leucine-rich repeat surface protein [Proteobacteria bacterium]|nr:MAG: BspA family leucine-rich repeat surface protein [Pseudomonadota bacterium]
MRYDEGRMRSLWLKLILVLTTVSCNGDISVWLPGSVSYSIDSQNNLVEPDSYTLTWEAVRDARSYNVKISTTESCDSDGLINLDDLRSTSAVLDFLAEGVYSICVFARVSGINVPAKNNPIRLTIDRKEPVATMPRQIMIVSKSFQPDVKIEDISKVVVQWSKLEGEGAVSFLDSSSLEPGISADTTGLYTLQLRVTDEAGHVKDFICQFYWKNPAVDPYAATLVKSGVAGDSYVNSAEELTSEPLWTLNKSTSLFVYYTLPIADPSLNVVCDSRQNYSQSDIPSALELPGVDGTFIICARLSLVGNDESYVKSEPIVKDTAPPTASSFVRANVASDGLIGDAEKNSALPLATMTAVNSVETLYSLPLSDVGGVLICDASVTYAQTAVASAQLMSVDGTFAVCAQMKDIAGNLGYAKSQGWVRDTSPPTITVSSLTTLDITPALTGTVSDPDAAIHITVNGSTYTAVNDHSGHWTLANNTVDALPNGIFNVTAEATDIAGNIGVDVSTNELTVNAKIFIASWKTNNAGASNSQSIRLPIEASGEYDFEADWGDGNINYISSGTAPEALHSYSSAGTYTVQLRGLVKGFSFRHGGDRLKILQISQWGDLRLGVFPGGFYGSNNLTVTATDIPNLTTAIDFADLFAECTLITTIPNIGSWNVSSVTGFQGTFANMPSFNDDISAWNVGAGTTFSYMFVNDVAFNQNLNSWNMASATNLAYMFHVATSFNSPLNSWNVSNVVNMEGTFFLASAFNQNLNSWNTSKVTNINKTFEHATAFNGDITSWNTALVNDLHRTFADATNFNQNIGGWNVGNVEWMEATFGGATSFNQNLNTWNTSKVLGMACTFCYASAFNGNITNWNTSKVTTMRWMFLRATIFNQNISSWDVSKVVDFGAMFDHATAFNQPIGSWNVGSALYMPSMFGFATAFNQTLSTWDVSDVTDFGWMFESSGFNQPINSWIVSSAIKLEGMFKNSSFNQALASWNVSNVTTMSAMFENTPFNQDISSWSTANVEKMNHMFYRASAFNQPIGSWNVGKVTEAEHMFREATSFNQPLNAWNVSALVKASNMFMYTSAFSQPLNNWQVGNVTAMTAMFEGSAFNQNISNWNTSKVEDMGWMFKNATNYNQPMAWDVSKVKVMVAMFENTPFNQDISAWNTENVEEMAWMFAHTDFFNGDISGWNTSKVYYFRSMFEDAIAFNQNIGGWDITAATVMIDMLRYSSSMSRANYDALLIGWAAQTVHTNVIFDANSYQYSTGAAAAARGVLTGAKGWTITDSGVGP